MFINFVCVTDGQRIALCVFLRLIYFCCTRRRKIPVRMSGESTCLTVKSGKSATPLISLITRSIFLKRAIISNTCCGFSFHLVSCDNSFLEQLTDNFTFCCYCVLCDAKYIC